MKVKSFLVLICISVAISRAEGSCNCCAAVTTLNDFIDDLKSNGESNSINQEVDISQVEYFGELTSSPSLSAIMKQNKLILQKLDEYKSICTSPCDKKSGPIVEGEKVCNSGWILNGNSCYYFGKHHQKVDWSGARAYCKSVGSALVSIRSSEENDFVLSRVTQRSWTGLNDNKRENYFYWLEGDRAVFTDFHRNEPNNEFGNEDCVEIVSWDRQGKVVKWNDQPCSHRNVPICKQPAKYVKNPK